jgi:hypothetical protein
MCLAVASAMVLSVIDFKAVLRNSIILATITDAQENHATPNVHSCRSGQLHHTFLVFSLDA